MAPRVVAAAGHVLVTAFGVDLANEITHVIGIDAIAKVVPKAKIIAKTPVS